MEDNRGQILLYQTPDWESKIDVKLEDETDGDVVSTQ